jgi:hypothetical protein
MIARQRSWASVTPLARSALAAWLVGAPWLTVAGAQTPSAGQFVADPQSGCRVWNPHPQAGEAVVWSGACVNGLAQGTGRLQWLRDGQPYERDEGEWREGRQEGHGSQDWSSGRYVGDLVGGEPQGQGALTLRTAHYEGEFRAGVPHGAG